MKLLIILAVIIFILLLLFLYSACVISSECSRIEKKLLYKEENIEQKRNKTR